MVARPDVLFRRVSGAVDASSRVSDALYSLLPLLSDMDGELSDEAWTAAKGLKDLASKLSSFLDKQDEMQPLP